MPQLQIVVYTTGVVVYTTGVLGSWGPGVRGSGGPGIRGAGGGGRGAGGRKKNKKLTINQNINFNDLLVSLERFLLMGYPNSAYYFTTAKKTTTIY